MRYEVFIGKVQRLTNAPSRIDAAVAVRTTLELFGEGMPTAAARRLAAGLPLELGRSLLEGAHGKEFGVEVLFERLSEREGVDVGDAALHAWAVVQALRSAVTEEVLTEIRAQLPSDYRVLFDRASVTNRAAVAG